MSDKTYNEHLQELVKSIPPVDLSDLPSAEDILIGVLPKIELSYDQKIALIKIICDNILESYKKYGYKQNIVTDNKVENFLKFMRLSNFNPEIQILGMRQLTVSFKIFFDTRGHEWNRFSNEYKKYIHDR